MNTENRSNLSLNTSTNLLFLLIIPTFIISIYKIGEQLL